MVELTLPQEFQGQSRASATRRAPGAKHVREFKVYRYDPETGENPRWDTYDVDLDSCGPMVLDALIAIKNDIDFDADLPPLLPRRRLRLVRDEHWRPQHARLHQGHRRIAGRRDHDLAAAAPAGAEGFGAGSHQLHRAVRGDPAVSCKP